MFLQLPILTTDWGGAHKKGALGGSSALVQSAFGAHLPSSSLQPSRVGAAKYRDVSALELSYLQLTAVDLHRVCQQTDEGRKTWNEPGDTEIPLCLFPLLLQTLSLSQPNVLITVRFGGYL